MITTIFQIEVKKFVSGKLNLIKKRSGCYPYFQSSVSTSISCISSQISKFLSLYYSLSPHSTNAVFTTVSQILDSCTFYISYQQTKRNQTKIAYCNS